MSASGKSEMDLSRASGVPQYTISKFLHGRIKSLTPDIQKLLAYADIGIPVGVDVLSTDPRIRQALGNAWDGTEGGTELLARTIHALGPVIRTARSKAQGE